MLTELSADTGNILRESAGLKLQDIVRSALAEVTLYRKALSMTGAEFDEKFAEIKEFFKKSLPTPRTKKTRNSTTHG